MASLFICNCHFNPFELNGRFMNDTYRTAKIKWVIRGDRVNIKTELFFTILQTSPMSHRVYAKCLQFDIFCENLTWADDYFTVGRNYVFQSFELAVYEP
jgi:hypothetical protein